MSVALSKVWTEEAFLSWARRQEGRYEFDGFKPVAMTGGNANHGRIAHNIYSALGARLRGTPCSCFGPDLAVRTTAGKIRYPDALVTCTRFPGTAYIAPNPVIVFEVISLDSGGRDRIEKLREYAAVPSIRRYVIVESAGIGLTVLHRPEGGDAFTALPLLAEDTLHLPEIGIEVRVAEFYLDVEFDDDAPSI
jgi:Uma2 family endonuclease